MSTWDHLPPMQVPGEYDLVVTLQLFRDRVPNILGGLADLLLEHGLAEPEFPGEAFGPHLVMSEYGREVLAACERGDIAYEEPAPDVQNFLRERGWRGNLTTQKGTDGPGQA